MAYIVAVGTVLNPEFVGPFDRFIDAKRWSNKVEHSEVIKIIPDDEYSYGLPDFIMEEISEPEDIIHGPAQFDHAEYEPEIELTEVDTSTLCDVANECIDNIVDNIRGIPTKEYREPYQEVLSAIPED